MIIQASPWESSRTNFPCLTRMKRPKPRSSSAHAINSMFLPLYPDRISANRQRNTPIVFLHNVTGFMVGAKAEHAGIIKMGAQLVSAVSCSTVPHISIILGASYGAGNYAMCGRAYRPRFIFTWPIGRCSVMGPDQLSGVMETIQVASAKAKGQNLEPEKLKEQVASFRRDVYRDAESYSTSSALIDDGIIDPRDTRDVLGMCLETVTLESVVGTESHQLLARI